MFTTFGMHKATNFQSNLDHTRMDVSEELLEVLAEHSKLTFLQLYVDSLHAHLDMPYKHLVSGYIVTCGLSHPNYNQAIVSRAANYLRHMRDLIHWMVGQLGSRIEEVVRFEEAVPCVLNAEEDFNLRRLMRLFDRRAMLVPFKDSPTVGVLSILKDVMSFWLRGSPNSIVTTGEWHGMM